MRGNDVPAIVEAYPRLRLTADLAGRAVAVEEGVCRRKIAAVGRDHRAIEFAQEPFRRAGAPKGTNLVHPIKIFADAITQRAWIIPEQRFECRDIIGDE